MSTPQDQIRATAQAEVAKAEAWFKRWYYQVSIGVAIGVLVGHVLWR